LAPAALSLARAAKTRQPTIALSAAPIPLHVS